MSRDPTLETVQRKFELLCPLMNERMRRHWAACEAMTLQRGGVTLVAQATGLSRSTIWAGMRELRQPQEVSDDESPCPTQPSCRGWPPLPQRDRPYLDQGLGSPPRSDHPRRSPIPAPLDVQEHPQLGRGTQAARPQRQLPDGSCLAPRSGLQPASQP